MKILVTGGAGYVGSTLVPLLLNSDHNVRVLDCLAYGGRSLLGVWSHPEFSFLCGDVCDKNTIREALRGIQAVVHLAAIVGDPACAKNPEKARAINLQASLDLLAESKRAGVERFIFASTCSNYGKMADSSQYAVETSELRPVSLYAETKVAVEKAVLDPAQTDSMCATSLRFATVFGVSPRMRFDLTVNEFTMELIRKQKLVVYGEQFWRPYISVRDIARAVATVLSAPKNVVSNAVFNVGSTEQNYQKQQLVEMIKPHAPQAIIEFVHKDEDPRDYRVSFAKIQKTLGFACEQSVKSGIQDIAELVNNGVIKDFDNPEYKNI
ncbi:MAG: NAD-dependent epimerase/dehydratase family protein [Thermoguttaceae bacterium]